MKYLRKPNDLNAWSNYIQCSARLLSTVTVDALMEDNKFSTIFLFLIYSQSVLWARRLQSSYQLIYLLIKRNRCLNHTVLLSQIHHYVNWFHSKYTWLARRKQFPTDNISNCSSQTKKQRSWESSEGFFLSQVRQRQASFGRPALNCINHGDFTILDLSLVDEHPFLGRTVRALRAY